MKGRYHHWCTVTFYASSDEAERPLVGEILEGLRERLAWLEQNPDDVHEQVEVEDLIDMEND